MSPRLYSIRNVLSSTFHYGLTGGLFVGACIMFPSPLLIAAAVIGIGGITARGVRRQTNTLRNSLVPYEKMHQYSPRLGVIVDDLYQASGLKADNNPIYSFEEKEQPKKEGDKEQKNPDENLMAKALNAMALNIDTPIIMISEPLLHLLTHEEEKAVLAHEFTHAAANHSYLGLGQRTAAGMAGMITALNMYTTQLSQGFSTFLLATAAYAGGLIGFNKYVTNKIFPKPKVSKDAEGNDVQEEQPLADLQKRQKLSKLGSFLSDLTGTAVFAYFIPGYLPLWATVKGWLRV